MTCGVTWSITWPIPARCWWSIYADSAIMPTSSGAGRAIPCGSGLLAVEGRELVGIVPRPWLTLWVSEHGAPGRWRSDVRVIALWLSHADVRSTNAYLHADLAIKEWALALTTPTGSPPGRYRPPDRLLAFLEGL
jgi:hypothetical protein